MRAQHAFVCGTDRAFAVAALFLVLTVTLIAVVVRTPPASPSAQAAAVHVGE